MSGIMSRGTLFLVIGLSVSCGGKVIFDTGGTMGSGGNTQSQSHSSTTGSVTTGPVQGSPLIACGMNQCTTNADQECCATPVGDSCVPISAKCVGVAMHCSSVANCVGDEVCCTYAMNNSISSDCIKKPLCTNQQLCAMSSECLNGAICVDGPNGIRFCQPAVPGTSGNGGG